MAAKQRYAQEIITGIFMVAVVALLIFFTVVISGVDMLHGRRTTVRKVLFDNIGALKLQDPVVVRGLKIGSVQRLKLRPDGVEATLRLQEAVPIREDYAVTIDSVSLLGGSQVVIETGDAGPELPADALLRGTPTPDVMDEVGAAVADIRAALDGNVLRETMVNLKTVTDDLTVVSERLRSGKGTVGRLLSEDDTLYVDLAGTVTNLRHVSDALRRGDGLLGRLLDPNDRTYDDLSATAANIRMLTQDLQEGKGLLGKLLKTEDATYDDLSATIANVRQLTAKLNNSQGGLGRLLSSDSTAAADLESTLANLRDITGKINSGTGTFGHFVNSDELAIDAEAALKDVRQIIDNLRDTAPITTFSSLFFSGF